MAALLVLGVVGICAALLWRLARPWRRSRRIEGILKQQGLKGPPPKFLAGNSGQQYQMRIENQGKVMETCHDIVAHVTPEVVLWSSKYGKPYLTRSLDVPDVTFFDPDCAREILSRQFENFPKSSDQVQVVIDVVGHGVLGLEGGQEWSQRRNVLSPAFHTLKLKAMYARIRACSEKLVAKWKTCVPHGQAELEVAHDLKKLAADLISHVAFGANYEKGEQVFRGLTVLGDLALEAQSYFWLPLFSYYPCPLNRKIWKVKREIDRTVMSLIHERRRSSGNYGDDLLGLILEESDKSAGFSDKVVVDECKTFFLAGHETTGSLLGWTLFMLALNPDWQNRARAEVQEHFKENSQVGALDKLKLVGMILYETLRLYPAISEVQRVASKDTVLGGIKVPEGTQVTIPLLWLHHDPELWGADANEFNPERFSQGAAKASKHPSAYMPFVMGPRVCIGQTLALLEAKVAIATLLSNFAFSPASSYRHSPRMHVIIDAPRGIQLVVHKLSE
ncbi:hypothetical protein SELMODRAFT_145354 [Selaginella moellendorffii]|uniref:Uncharacterized protein n=1 Tax=Selaginella moellendorffii TaxID=88036 RepID=D8RAM0_SELML|nr:cytokinin hydroxylase [Selaginella moellendorffii]EFJ30645.1 hypothetical protein SELMODRAFT_145354 [Selaginella moellendorffii]|eukprot:XP_002968391.1 cytokinin hydroxylase [Selaginella moellendorffii]